MSSIVFAFLLSQEAGQLHVPVMNIEASDYELKTDVRCALSDAGIDVSELVFYDQLGPGAQAARVVLVDHNRLAASQEPLLAPRVSGVLDHHRDEGLFPDAVPRRIEFPLGSACTLVADHAFGKGYALDAGVGKLLLGTILIDTANLDPDFGKTEPLDAAMAEKLCAVTGLEREADRTAFYERLNKAKYDVGSLTPAQLLRKDYKQFLVGKKTQLGMSAVLKNLRSFDVLRLTQDAAQWIDKRDLDVLIVQTAFYAEPDGAFSRQLAVCTRKSDKRLHAKVCDMLTRSNLELKAMASFDSPHCNWNAFDQHNIACSRKQTQPMLANFFAAEAEAEKPNVKL